MTTSIIPNYVQLKEHLAALSREYNTTARDYYFAVGDAFNEAIPPLSSMAGVNPRRLHREIMQVLEDTETDISLEKLQHLRGTARAWPRNERIYDVAFTVYRVLCGHKDLMREGLKCTEARALVSENPLRLMSDETRARMSASSRASHNRTQTMRISINTWRGILDNDDGSSLTEEEKVLIGEAYAVLDDYCERKGISMYDQLEAA